MLVGLAITAAVAIAALTFLNGSAERPAFQGAYEAYTPMEDGSVLPKTAFLDKEDRAIKLADLPSRLYLVNFWATWCAPCLKEMPTLVALQEKFDVSEFRVVLVSTDRKPPETVEETLTSRGITTLTSLYISDRKLTGSLGVLGLPTSLVVSEEGRILGRLSGDADWGSSDAETLINSYLEPKGK